MLGEFVQSRQRKLIGRPARVRVAVVERIVGMQTGEKVEQREPPAEEDPFLGLAELATIEPGDFLDPVPGPRRAEALSTAAFAPDSH